MKFALYFGNRGFFPESLIEEARNEMKKVVESLGFETLIMPDDSTKYGAVETVGRRQNICGFSKQERLRRRYIESAEFRRRETAQ